MGVELVLVEVEVVRSTRTGMLQRLARRDLNFALTTIETARPKTPTGTMSFMENG